MKIIKSTIVVVLLMAFVHTSAHAQVVKDTTFIFNQKKIHLTDSLEQVKLKVYRSDTVEYKKIYEAIYTDETSYENYTVSESFGLNLPFPKKSSGIWKIHSDDFRVGLVYLHNKFDFNNDGGLMISNANEITWKPVLAVKRFHEKRMAFTTGLGLTWRNYHIGENSNLTVAEGLVRREVAPEGVKYNYSRLRTMEVNLPLMYEWQPAALHGFHFSTGVIFGVNVFTSHKVKYRDPNTDKKVKDVLGKNYQINPFSFSGIVQAGYRDLGVYFKYTPTTIFKKDKGPELQSMAIGVSLAF